MKPKDLLTSLEKDTGRWKKWVGVMFSEKTPAPSSIDWEFLQRAAQAQHEQMYRQSFVQNVLGQITNVPWTKSGQTAISNW